VTGESPEDFERQLRSSKLVENEELIMPSFVDALGELDLAKAIDVENLVQAQATLYQDFLKEQSIKSAPEEFVGFVVPLDAYIPIAEGYPAASLTPGEAEGIARTSIVSLSSISPTISLGTHSIKIRQSVLLVSLSDHDATHKSVAELEESGILLNQYHHALKAANDVVLAYRLTPGRHNHNLAPVTLLGRPGSVPVIRCRLSRKPEIRERTAVTFHQNTLAGVLHAREILETELDNFRSFHASLGTYARYPTVLLTAIYDAIDARCKGQNDIAVIRSDAFAEHILRYLLYQVLVPDLGERGAGEKIDSIYRLDSLLSQLAGKLGLTSAELKNKINFETWDRDCRKIRNSLTHVFLEHYLSEDDSRLAVTATLNMVRALIDLLEEQFADPSGIFFGLLRSVTWNPVFMDLPAE